MTSISPTPTDELAALRAEVRASADHAELTDLVGRLARWLDGLTAEDPATLFAPDIRATTPGGTAEGRDAVVAQARRNHDLPTHHLMGSVVVEVDGDHARIGAHMTGHFVRSEGTAPGPTELGAHYDLRAARGDDGRWRLTALETATVWRVE
ncbi:MAG TPA: nuclear transport factor 2 family protein [Baekduia sp.]|uniref:nuclear transport factor 2 family protein n=1 Tax=Baekduia sp. TaxID=2600305 RepID=UPI002D78C904|nr:nuclear transport factor 2 family protein [Baekduia sp.]HET6509751.1 nuclear transport factor 2 family protein [Baekduia sp.]